MILSMFMEPSKAAEAVKKAADTTKAAVEGGTEPIKEIVKTAPLETEHSWSMPTGASTFAESTDALYWFIVALDVLFFALVIGAMVYFMWKYRRKSKDQKTSSITHNGKIEFLWSAIPAILLVVVFIWGEVDFVKQSVPPSDALDVRVTGRKWYWTVEYPNYPGVILASNVEQPVVTMIVPKDRPVRLTMTSQDVLHSFFVPAFRVKRDVVPGRYTQLWFEATRVGEFNLFCTEYCGDWHSKMTGVVKVMEPENFEAAIEEAGKLEKEETESDADFGKRIYSRRGCNACHSVEGKDGTGPAWNGMYGKTEQTDKGPVEVDDDYIRRSILEPNAEIVAGYAAGMPSFQGQLEDEHIVALIEYMKTLK